MRRRPAPALVITTAVLLTACTGGAENGRGSGTSPIDGSAPADVTASGTAAPDPAASDPASDEPLAPATEECVVGTWQLDLAAMQDDLRRMVAGSDGGVEVEVTGTTTYEIRPGGGFGATVDSSSSITLSGDGSDLTSTSVSTGALTGAWALEGDVLVVSDVDPGDLAVTTTATMDGEEIDVPPGAAEDAIGALPPTSSTASCGPGRLTLVMPLQEDEDSEPVNITYTLRR